MAFATRPMASTSGWIRLSRRTRRRPLRRGREGAANLDEGLVPPSNKELSLPAKALRAARCTRGGEALKGNVEQVCSSPTHSLRKSVQSAVRLLEGLGVEGDAHCGATVKHRSRVQRDPRQPNLRQVHLIHAELHEELAEKGFPLAPGEMGENVTTRGIDLLGLPVGALLHLGDETRVRVTGLRNPCAQLDDSHPGLMAATLDRDEDGELVRKAGIMGIVVRTGEVRAGDSIRSELPPPPHRRLERV